MQMVPKAGEIYWDHTIDGEAHPAVVVSRKELNRGNTVVVVPITSQKYKTRSRLPNCAPFRAGQYGLSKNCVGQAENVHVVEKALLDLEGGPLGVLDGGAMRNVVRALGYVFGAELEPS